jgi:hypothetical protein
MSPGPATADELARLAELVARQTGQRDTAALEARIADALVGLRGRPALTRLVAVATDTSRPLPRRVAVLAALHRALT